MRAEKCAGCQKTGFETYLVEPEGWVCVTCLERLLAEARRQVFLVTHERDYLHGESALLERQRNEAREELKIERQAKRLSQEALIRVNEQLCDWQTRAIEAERKL